MARPKKSSVRNIYHQFPLLMQAQETTRTSNLPSVLLSLQFFILFSQFRTAVFVVAYLPAVSTLVGTRSAPSQDKGKQLQNKKQEEFQEEAVVCPCHQTGLCTWGLSLCLVAGSRLARLEHSSFLDHLLPEELASLDFPSHQEIVSIACSSF